MSALARIVIAALAVLGLLLGGQYVHLALAKHYATICADPDETDYGFTIPHIDTRARDTQRL